MRISNEINNISKMVNHYTIAEADAVTHFSMANEN